MLRVRVYALGTLSLLMAFTSRATAQTSIPLLVSGSPNVIVDTNQNNKPDPGDGFCKASVIFDGSSPVKKPAVAQSDITINESDGVQVLVECAPDNDAPVTGPLPPDGLRALMGNYLFDVVNFDSSASTGQLHQVDATVMSPDDQVVSPDRFIDGKGFPQAGPGGVGMSRVIQITNQRDGSSQGGGVLCTSDGSPSALITLANGLHVLRKLDLLSCDYSSCSPSSGSPNFLRAPNVPFEEDHTGFFVLRDIYIPVATDGSPKLTLSAQIETLFIPLGSADLSNLGACGAGAPTISSWGLILMAFVLLTVGTWAIGRRNGFSQSLIIP